MGSKYSIIASTQWYWEGSKKYGREGFLKASKNWDPKALDKDLTGLHYIVTGANSGLGFETAKQFAQRNAVVHMLCRSEEKGTTARQQIVEATRNDQIHLHVVDLSNFDSIQNFATKYNSDYGSAKVLVNNAGLMPETLKKSEQGIELSFATMVGGSFLLTGLLLPSLKAARPSHVINVSSGGMYTAKMDLGDVNFEKSKYDALFAYSNSKRAMVYLTELWSRKVIDDVLFHSMHPGWTDTPGVRTSLPKFADRQGENLRTQDQGADTIIWLGTRPDSEILPSGQFWFDREPVPEDMSRFTKNSEADKDQLWTYCEKLCNRIYNADTGTLTHATSAGEGAAASSTDGH
eukprot:gb/GECG01008474.1/.p1 GENE.gb/GECG01008474.1/~~gb/GECG01008474.1/.p1  ORF type:complete len:348 (+),score=38.04 gb/GECG01008474.1/:1-1044(+)